MEEVRRPGWSFEVWDILADYGWYLLAAGAVLVYLYNKIQPNIDKYFAKKAEEDYAAIYHKDLTTSRLWAQQVAVQKLQEKYNTDAVKYQEKVEEKEAKKREDRLQKQSKDGYRLGSGLKPEYNPLMGDSAGSSYRPQRKSPCGGGGCGR